MYQIGHKQSIHHLQLSQQLHKPPEIYLTVKPNYGILYLNNYLQQKLVKQILYKCARY